jgi:superfamily II DNA or RNA helicase
MKYINLPFDNSIIDEQYNTKSIINNINSSILNLSIRDYQYEAYQLCHNKNRSIISLPCGMGKTFTSFLIANKYENIIIIAPYRDLVLQNIDRYNQYSNNTYNNIIISSDGTRDTNNIIDLIKDRNLIGVTYKSICILNKIISLFTNVIIIIDEFHNLNNELPEIKTLLSSQNKILFLSATPENFSNTEYYGDTIFNYSWNLAIKNGFINDFHLHIPTFKDYITNIDNLIDVDKFTVGFYIDKDELKKYLFNLVPKINFFINGFIKNNNKKCIVYLSDINETIISCIIFDLLCKFYNTTIDIFKINYTNTRNYRNNIIEEFIKSKNNAVLLNVHILDEGIDIPSCDSVFITNPSNDMNNLIQRISRCNRKKDYDSHVYIWTDNNKTTDILEYLNKKSDVKYNKKINKTDTNSKEPNNYNLLLHDIIVNNINRDKYDNSNDLIKKFLNIDDNITELQNKLLSNDKLLEKYINLCIFLNISFDEKLVKSILKNISNEKYSVRINKINIFIELLKILEITNFMDYNKDISKKFHDNFYNQWLDDNKNLIIELFNLRAEKKYNNINNYYTVYLLSITIFKHLFDEDLLNDDRVQIKKKEYYYYNIYENYYNDYIKQTNFNISTNVSLDEIDLLPLDTFFDWFHKIYEKDDNHKGKPILIKSIYTKYLLSLYYSTFNYNERRIFTLKYFKKKIQTFEFIQNYYKNPDSTYNKIRYKQPFIINYVLRQHVI